MPQGSLENLENVSCAHNKHRQFQPNCVVYRDIKYICRDRVSQRNKIRLLSTPMPLAKRSQACVFGRHVFDAFVCGRTRTASLMIDVAQALFRSRRYLHVTGGPKQNAIVSGIYEPSTRPISSTEYMLAISENNKSM